MRKILMLIVLTIFVTANPLFAQVAINTDGSVPDASAMLDIKNSSPSRGLLIPRMTSALRTGIGTPADGLLVYDTDTKSFWFFKTGTGWTEIASFTLPYSATINSPLAFPGAAFQIINSNTSSGSAGNFQITSSTNSGSALSAMSAGTGNAFRAEVSANTATAIFGRTTGSSLGAAGSFVNDNASNTNVTVGIFSNASGSNAHALSVAHTGGGRAGSFEINNTTNTSSGFEIASNGALASRAFKVTHAGFGGAADIQIANTLNVNNVLFINHLGLGRGALIQSTNPANTQTIVDVFTAGTGIAFASQNAGTGGRAGNFAITNAANSESALYATTSGSGNAIRAEVSSSAATAIFGRITGTSLGAAGAFVNDNLGNTNNTLLITTNATNASANALDVSTTGGGRAATFDINNASNVSSGIEISSNGALASRAFKVTHTGFGGAADIQVFNTSNLNNALFINHLGLGRGALIQSTNPANTRDILDVFTAGTGSALTSRNGGTSGTAASFSNSASANASNVLEVTGPGAGFVAHFDATSNSTVAGAVHAETNTSAGGGNSAAVFGVANGTVGHAGYFYSPNANTRTTLVALHNGTNNGLLVNHNGASGNIAVFQSASTNVARIDKTGKGFFNGGTQASGADLAEAFKVEGPLQQYEPGDVLEISATSDRTVTKSNGAYSTMVAGVYATKPGVLLTEETIDADISGHVPMGVVGVLPTKVCNENGPIKRGDLLVTSSIPGYAMKADIDKIKPGQLIGKSLQEELFISTTTAKIKVLVSVK